ncbi:MAG: FGGY family carbohydrate kinase [Bacteroidales bacterium]
MLLLGLDIGSSSVKASVLDGLTGNALATAYSPLKEMEIVADRPGWAEQDPLTWWENVKVAVKKCTASLGSRSSDIGAVGIAYQMHGLVLTGDNQEPLRKSIIWCDSRAVEYGSRAFTALGKGFCLSHLLNSPANFTAAKLAWVKENEPGKFSSIKNIMLPGDFIAMKLTGEIMTSFTGLSEGIFWDYATESISRELTGYFGFPDDFFPVVKNSFSLQGQIRKDIAGELGLPAGIPVSYRAGDQPNNALSLNVLSPGEVAATAGTSGVIYGVTDQKKADPQSRVNTFLHVNHSSEKPRLGVLLCINGTGILNSWIRRISDSRYSYDEMNKLAENVAPGSEGLMILPFGNGAERMLGNANPGAIFANLDFNRHSHGHLFRAAQEGIAFSFRYGLDIMRQTGIEPAVMRAGEANMFLSPLFRQALSCVTGAVIDLYNTDGSLGAARGAGIGCGFYKSEKEAFTGLAPVGRTEPDPSLCGVYAEAYENWTKLLLKNQSDNN